MRRSFPITVWTRWCLLITVLHLFSKVVDQWRLCSERRKRFFIKCIADFCACSVFMHQSLRKSWCLKILKICISNDFYDNVSHGLLAWLHLFILHSKNRDSMIPLTVFMMSTMSCMVLNVQDLEFCPIFMATSLQMF